MWLYFVLNFRIRHIVLLSLIIPPLDSGDFVIIDVSSRNELIVSSHEWKLELNWSHILFARWSESHTLAVYVTIATVTCWAKACQAMQHRHSSAWYYSTYRTSGKPCYWTAVHCCIVCWGSARWLWNCPLLLFALYEQCQNDDLNDLQLDVDDAS